MSTRRDACTVAREDIDVFTHGNIEVEFELQSVGPCIRTCDSKACRASGKRDVLRWRDARERVLPHGLRPRREPRAFGRDDCAREFQPQSGVEPAAAVRRYREVECAGPALLCQAVTGVSGIQADKRRKREATHVESARRFGVDRECVRPITGIGSPIDVPKQDAAFRRNMGRRVSGHTR